MPVANAKRITQERQQRFLSREEFAGKCGIDPRVLKKIEDGEPVSDRTIKKINDFLKIGADNLLDEPVCVTEPDAESEGLLGRWAGRIEQPHGPDEKPFSGEVELEFCCEGAGVVGCYEFTFEGTAYRCSGPVAALGGGYFKFDAVSDNGWMFNTFYFHITRPSDRIDGCYVGFGPHSDRVISGRASGRKVAVAEGAPAATEPDGGVPAVARLPSR